MKSFTAKSSLQVHWKTHVMEASDEVNQVDPSRMRELLETLVGEQASPDDSSLPAASPFGQGQGALTVGIQQQQQQQQQGMDGSVGSMGGSVGGAGSTSGSIGGSIGGALGGAVSMNPGQNSNYSHHLSGQTTVAQAAAAGSGPNPLIPAAAAAAAAQQQRGVESGG